MWPVTDEPIIPAQERAWVQWQRALLVADLLASDPHALHGASIRAGAGPVRDAWLAYFLVQLARRNGQPWVLHRLPLNASDDRLLGGLDLVATLAMGRPVAESGLLARANEGVLLASMAERMTTATSARLCAVIDTGRVQFARDGLQGEDAARFVLIAFDEGVADDERPPAALLDRLAFRLDLRDIPVRVLGPVLRPSVPSFADDHADGTIAALEPSISDEHITALCNVALVFGIASTRATQRAVAAARTSARVFGRDAVSEDDVTMAAELVLAPIAKSLPNAAPQPDENEPTSNDSPDDDPSTSPQENSQNETPPPPPSPPPNNDQDQRDDDRDAKPPSNEKKDDTKDQQTPMEDRVLDAAQAAIPADLLAQLQAMLSSPARALGQRSGSAGRLQQSNLRGRPLASRRGDPKSGARLDVLATLRAAAPWQSIRRAERARLGVPTTAAASPILIRRDDWHVSRRAHRSETLTLFAVDASGSAALHRLAEAKGAAELLLAECYVRRDQVAVVSFRGKTAETLLAPTRSLVRAKRSLASLPGGGGTPLAAGIDIAFLVADAAQRRGMTPTLVFLTDGRANVARDGSPGRPQAAADALMAAKRLRSGGFNVLMIDTSPEPQAAAKALADAMRGRYLGLPYAGAAAISAAVLAQTRPAR
jgi:magnesium chelatase subunit D